MPITNLEADVKTVHQELIPAQKARPPANRVGVDSKRPRMECPVHRVPQVPIL
jgi:hypothetical protein